VTDVLPTRHVAGVAGAGGDAAVQALTKVAHGVGFAQAQRAQGKIEFQQAARRT
jgi:hypothetical protein